MPYITIFSSSSVTDYFAQSNLAGQIIVLLLLAFSVLAWGLMFCKNSDLSAMDSSNKETMRKISKSSSLIEAAAAKSLHGPYAVLLRDAVDAWGRFGMGANESESDKAARANYVENSLQRAISKQIVRYESKMIWLGTIISGAPFLGLLGTVWGVMDCFGSMSAQTSVTLQQLAPGVAGALLTTVAGLLVAIPAVFGYNYLTWRARTMSSELENFASLLADKIELESREASIAESREKPAERKPVMASKVEETPRQTKVINFSLEDDDEDTPTPLRDFD